jgi:hypothetical protein
LAKIWNHRNERAYQGMKVHRSRQNRGAADLHRLPRREVEFIYAFEHGAALAQLQRAGKSGLYWYLCVDLRGPGPREHFVGHL